MNIWAKIGIGAALTAGVAYVFRLKRTSAELESVSTGMIHKLDLTGLTIRVDVQLKNPTKGSLKIKYPFVKVIYKDATIGSSQVMNQDIQIPSFGEARIEKIMIRVPIAGIFSIGADLIKALKVGSQVKVQIKTISTVDLGWKTLPYEKTDEVTLANKKSS